MNKTFLGGYILNKEYLQEEFLIIQRQKLPMVSTGETRDQMHELEVKVLMAIFGPIQHALEK